uniref:WH2 domain-containing protein n=1 Tax=Macrostomum lignano TaxID=282301 RepID=A0A1I8IB68_9PLAT
ENRIDRVVYKTSITGCCVSLASSRPRLRPLPPPPPPPPRLAPLPPPPPPPRAPGVWPSDLNSEVVGDAARGGRVAGKNGCARARITALASRESVRSTKMISQSDRFSFSSDGLS